MDPLAGSPLDLRRNNLEELEERAIEIIRSKGDEGIYQHELWKMLGLDSREGSRLALRLVKKGLILREPVVHNGRRTYKLFLAKKTAKTFRLDINIDVVMEVPCFTCRHLERCHAGRGFFYDPTTCPILRKWLDYKVKLLKKST